MCNIFKKYNISLPDLFVGYMLGSIITLLICLLGFRFLL